MGLTITTSTFRDDCHLARHGPCPDLLIEDEEWAGEDLGLPTAVDAALVDEGGGPPGGQHLPLLPEVLVVLD